MDGRAARDFHPIRGQEIRKRELAPTRKGLEQRFRTPLPRVERTHGLAIVAPKEMLADGLAQLDRNWRARLDRQIRNTPPGIDDKRPDDRLRRTNVDAS